MQSTCQDQPALCIAHRPFTPMSVPHRNHVKHTLNKQYWTSRTYITDLNNVCYVCMHVCMYVMLCHVMLCYVMSCYNMLWYVMSCYAMLCHVMSCYLLLCYVMYACMCVYVYEYGYVHVDMYMHCICIMHMYIYIYMCIPGHGPMQNVRDRTHETKMTQKW